MVVKTRFAPSPTGHLHVGGARTALFAWLYAKRHHGQFLLRIEDTDEERSERAYVDAIIEGMAWLGMHADEPPIFQTSRYERYLSLIDDLLEQGQAYRCNCSKARLDELRASQMAAKQKPRYDGHCRNQEISESEVHVVRFKNPMEGDVHFKDEVYGEITVSNTELDDLIIKRSDGNPTYNFVVVVDDADMGITHVIRGDDHINNTPRQINLYQALNKPIPTFAHLPMILGEDGKRLSKRHGAVSVLEFKKMGILPHALLNYLVRLGWSHQDQEIFSLEDMQAKFDLGSISRGAASFNYEKLYWLNQHYMKSDDAHDVAAALQAILEAEKIDISQGPDLKDIVLTHAERCQTLVEMAEKSKLFFESEVEFDATAVKKHLRPVVHEPMKALYAAFDAEDNWQCEALQQVINDVCAAFDLSMGKIAQPLRVAITGSGQSPAIDMTLQMLGKTKVLGRLTQAIAMIEARMSEASAS